LAEKELRIKAEWKQLEEAKEARKAEVEPSKELLPEFDGVVSPSPPASVRRSSRQSKSSTPKNSSRRGSTSSEKRSGGKRKKAE